MSFITVVSTTVSVIEKEIFPNNIEINNPFLFILDSTLKTDTVIQSVDIDKDHIKVEDSKGQRLCDALILTMPVPQILALKGNIQQLISM